MAETNSITERVTHTPGPWRVNETSWNGATVAGIDPSAKLAACRTLREDEVIVCDVMGAAGRHEANARLIAAAPALFSALTVEDIDQIVEAIENFVKGPKIDHELDALWQPYIDKLHALRSAIVEAGGQ